MISIYDTVAKLIDIPVVLHLDHGQDINRIKMAINEEYTSVMIDGSHLSLKNFFHKVTRVKYKII